MSNKKLQPTNHCEIHLSRLLYFKVQIGKDSRSKSLIVRCHNFTTVHSFHQVL